MIQRIIGSGVGRIAEMRLKIRGTQITKEGLIGMSKTSYAAASAILKDASYMYVKNVFTKMTLKY